ITVVDVTALTTTIALAPSSPDGSNGWYVSRPSFTLTAADGGSYPSGVATTSYAIDGGPAQLYSDAVSLADGQHTVSYWSTDKATNEETHHTTATIKVDTVKPSTSIALTPASPDGSNGFYSSTPSFTLSASDATSGDASRGN